MTAIQFIGTTPAEFLKEVKKEMKTILFDEFKKEIVKDFQPKEPTEYLTRAEVCEMLKIDLSTLHRWTNKGDLISYSIGNRVYYKRHEVEKTLNNNSSR